MKAIETFATFDKEGKMKIENSPSLKNKRVKLLILIEEDNEADFYLLSLTDVAGVYGDNEPEYDLSLVK